MAQKKSKMPSKSGDDASMLSTDLGLVDTDGDPGRVELSLAAYHDIVRRAVKQHHRPRPPVDYTITRASYDGRIASGEAHATLDVALSVEVFASGYTVVPLFDASLALAEATVAADDDSGSGKTASKRGTKKTTRSSSTNDDAGASEPTASDNDADSAEPPPALPTFSCTSHEHRLIARGPGRYAVALTLRVPLLGATARSGLELRVPQAAVARFALHLPHGGASVKVTPSLGLVTEDADGGEATRVEAMLPVTDHVGCEWGEPEPAVPAAKVKPMATAEVATLASVGEGVMLCQSHVQVRLLQGALAGCSFELPGDVSVLAVSGQSVKTWAAKKEGDGQRITVNLSYDITSHFEVIASYERTMADTSGRVDVPMLAMRDVERELGFVGVEARTNVEIETPVADGVARIDVQELPGWVSARAGNPLLFGFKYLKTPYHVTLAVTKHRDVNVLVAAVDVAFVEATLVEDGRLMTKARFMVRNNQQQFLRLSLPPKSTVWSTFVSQNPVKPARDDENEDTVLIALEKSQLVAESQRAFPVEVVYLTDVPELVRAGHAELLAPKVDVPVSHMLVKLCLPKGFRYDRFAGSLNKVDSFTRSFLIGDEPEPSSSPVTRAGVARMKSQVQMQSNVAFEEVMQEAAYEDEEEPDMGAFGGMVGQAVNLPAVFSMSKSKGVLPVKLNVPTGGLEFRFEKLLVLSEFADLSFRYKRTKR